MPDLVRRPTVGTYHARVHVSGWWWFGLLVLAPMLLALDMYVIPAGSGPIARRPALIWTLIWTALGLVFGAAVWATWGERYAIKYTTGYVVERALTINQVMVFALVLRSFRPPGRAATRAAFFAIWFALVLKLPFIVVGAFLGQQGGDPLRYGLSMLFVLGGVFLVRDRDHQPTVAENRYLRFLASRLDFVEEWHEDRLIIQADGRRRYTLEFALVVVLISVDLYFAASVPLAFASQKPPFLVFASSVLSVVGLRSLYWLFDSLKIDPKVIRVTLALVLWLVAGELLLSDALHDPSWLLPAAIASVLAVPIIGAARRRGPTVPLD